MRPPRFPRITGRVLRAGLGALALTSLAACDTPAPRQGPAGRALYERTVGGLACADCHGVEGRAPSPDWRLPGPSLAGVAGRTSFWGGRLEGDGALPDAVRLCAARFQYRLLEELIPEDGGKPDLARVPLTDADVTALEEYASAHAPEFASPEMRRVDDVDDVLDRAGDPERGERIWKASCAVCHGTDAEGGLGPSLRGTEVTDPFTLADYVRQGAPDVAPYAWMPYFPPELLPAQDLADIAARYAE